MKYLCSSVVGYNVAFILGTSYGVAELSAAAVASEEVRITGEFVLLISLLGALGGAIHGLASVVFHQGHKKLEPQWAGFYVARPFLGAGMSLVTMLILASGVGGFQAESQLALMAWAVLSGLYSQAALNKLRELFAALFHTDEKASDEVKQSTGSPKEQSS